MAMSQFLKVSISTALFVGILTYQQIFLASSFMSKYIDQLSKPYSQHTTQSLSLKGTEQQVFCIILTTPDKLSTKAFATLYVWVRQCADYRYITLKPGYLADPDNETVIKQSSFNLLQPTNLLHEDYYELTNKVYYAFSDIYKEVGDRYDWYLKADDDTYVNFDNLVKWMKKKDPGVAAIYGHSVHLTAFYGTPYNLTYNYGGPGYMMSKAAFRTLGEQLRKNMSFCQNTGIEDIDVADCLKQLGVPSESAMDETNRTMFNPHQFGYIETYMNEKLCCSNYSFISAHYMHPDHTMRLDLVTKIMEEEYRRGKIPRPSYTDIYIRLVYMSKFLNSSYKISTLRPDEM